MVFPFVFSSVSLFLVTLHPVTIEQPGRNLRVMLCSNVPALHLYRKHFKIQYKTVNCGKIMMNNILLTMWDLILSDMCLSFQQVPVFVVFLGF